MASEPGSDPLESLRLPAAPVAPRREFTTVLRRRIEEALGMSTSTVSDTPRSAVAATALIPYLCVDGADRAIAFYREVFDAVETMRIAEPEGRIGHAEVTIGTVSVMLSDEYPEIGVVSPTTLGGTPVALHLEVPDVDATHRRAVAAGATTLREPEDQFHGNRNAVVLDPFGHRWMLSTPVEAVSEEELRTRALADGFETTTPGRPGERIPQLGYWTLRVPDVDRAAAFYGALFGWAFEPRDTDDRRSYRHVSNTDVPMGVHDDAGAPERVLYYRVADLDAATARVHELGGAVLEVSDSPSGGNARCRDDQGVEFELWEPAPGYE